MEGVRVTNHFTKHTRLLSGDDLSLHAALPVTRGEKWLANFWIWDPKRHH
jgi:prolyl 4-hydroxylase